MSFWTKDKDLELTNLWKEPLTADDMARRLGAASHNAVVSRAHRLGLGPKHIVPAQHRKKFAVAPAMPEEKPPRAVIALADLEDHHCRFPFGDPQSKRFGFCGARKIPGKSYCLEHTERCFERAPVLSSRPDTSCSLSSRPVPASKPESTPEPHELELAS